MRFFLIFVAVVSFNIEVANAAWLQRCLLKLQIAARNVHTDRIAGFPKELLDLVQKIRAIRPSIFASIRENKGGNSFQFLKGFSALDMAEAFRYLEEVPNEMAIYDVFPLGESPKSKELYERSLKVPELQVRRDALTLYNVAKVFDETFPQHPEYKGRAHLDMLKIMAQRELLFSGDIEFLLTEFQENAHPEAFRIFLECFNLSEMLAHSLSFPGIDLRLSETKIALSMLTIFLKGLVTPNWTQADDVALGNFVRKHFSAAMIQVIAPYEGQRGVSEMKNEAAVAIARAANEFYTSRNSADLASLYGRLASTIEVQINGIIDSVDIAEALLESGQAASFVDALLNAPRIRYPAGTTRWKDALREALHQLPGNWWDVERLRHVPIYISERIGSWDFHFENSRGLVYYLYKSELPDIFYVGDQEFYFEDRGGLKVLSLDSDDNEMVVGRVESIQERNGYTSDGYRIIVNAGDAFEAARSAHHRRAIP